jgi:Aminoglycoside-2''-adenylyltransferase
MSPDGWQRIMETDGPMPIDTGLVSAEGAFPDLDRWNAWHPKQLASRLRALEVPWAVAAGWAIDLFAGRESRAHDDLEIVVARASFGAVRAALPELTWFGAGGLAGEAGRVWPVDDEPAELHQTWGWDSLNECWRVDVFREPWEGGTWVCRRDPSIRRPVADVIERDATGIPYLAPEIVLLFKAKHADRDKDAADFARALPLLDVQRRQWLADALRVVHPGHDWITLVADR